MRSMCRVAYWSKRHVFGINSPWSVAAKCIALAAGTVHSTQWSPMLAQNYDFCLPTCIRRPPLGEVPVGILPRRLVGPYSVWKNYTVFQKNMWPRYLIINWTRTVCLQRFLAYILLFFYFPIWPTKCSYVTLENCRDLNIMNLALLLIFLMLQY